MNSHLKSRRFYRIAAGYAAAAFVVWQVADIAFDAFGLPATAMRFVIIVAITGLPVALAVAWALDLAPQDADGPASPDAASPPAAQAPTAIKQRRWAVASSKGITRAVLAVALFVFIGATIAALPRPATTLPNGTNLIIADLENRTGDSIFDGTIVTALRVGLSQSPDVSVFPNGRIAAALAQMRRDSSMALDQATASEIALRESVAAVLVPSIERVGAGYRVSTRLVDPEDEAIVIARSATAADEDAVIDALDRLARQLRADVGESLASMVRRRVPLDRATTHSLEALRAWTEGNRLYSAGEAEAAALLYHRAVELDSAFALAHAALGQHYYWHKGDPIRGERHFEAALEHAADRATERERFVIRAKAAEWRGDREAAAEAYRAAVTLQPRDVASWSNLAYQHLMLGRHDEAIRTYEQVVALDSLHSNAWLNLATLYGSGIDHELADSLYLKAFSLAPAYRTVNNINHEYGLNLVALGNAEAAERAYTLMLDESPSQRAQGLRSIALLRMLEGRFREATVGFRQAMVLNRSAAAPTSELRNAGFLIESLVRRRAPADTELDTAERLAVAHYVPTWWVHHIGVWLARAGRIESATELRDTATARADESPQTRAAILRLEAEIALAQNDHAAALERLNEAIALYPDWIAPLITLADIHRRNDDLSEAESSLTSAIESRKSPPGNEDLVDWILARYHLAGILEQQGRIGEARRHYAAFVGFWDNGDPELTEVEIARARLAALSAR